MSRLWQKFTNVLVSGKLRLGKNAALTVTNADGSESAVSLTELAVLDGLTATASEINTACDGNTATAAEITRSCDASARIVTTTATALSLTVTQHAERIVLVNTNSTVANTFTLPVATGSGAKFTVINNLTQTQGTIVVAANGTTDTLKGVAIMANTTAANAEAFFSTATSDKVTFNLTTTGGLGGDTVEAWDSAANVWTVKVLGVGSGTLATPFSQT